MAVITLTRGFSTIVDDELFDWLSSFNWYAQGPQGRAARRLLGAEDCFRRLIYMYHQILRVEPWELNEKEVDHIDGNPHNNRRDNLRIVTHQENMLNRDASRNKKGVCFDATHHKWKAYLDRPGKRRINIGTFSTEADAICAVEKARVSEYKYVRTDQIKQYQELGWEIASAYRVYGENELSMLMVKKKCA